MGENFSRWSTILLATLLFVIIGSLSAVMMSAARMVGCEEAAFGSLLTLYRAQCDFRSWDRDKNQANDFWVGDVSGFYYLKDPKGAPIGLIDRDLADADFKPLFRTRSYPLQGYWFSSMKYDERGEPYDRGEHRTEGDFAFCAHPDYSGGVLHSLIFALCGGSFRCRDARNYTRFPAGSESFLFDYGGPKVPSPSPTPPPSLAGLRDDSVELSRDELIQRLHHCKSLLHDGRSPDLWMPGVVRLHEKVLALPDGRRSDVCGELRHWLADSSNCEILRMVAGFLLGSASMEGKCVIARGLGRLDPVGLHAVFIAFDLCVLPASASHDLLSRFWLTVCTDFPFAVPHYCEIYCRAQGGIRGSKWGGPGVIDSFFSDFTAWGGKGIEGPLADILLDEAREHPQLASDILRRLSRGSPEAVGAANELFGRANVPHSGLPSAVAEGPEAEKNLWRMLSEETNDDVRLEILTCLETKATTRFRELAEAVIRHMESRPRTHEVMQACVERLGGIQSDLALAYLRKLYPDHPDLREAIVESAANRRDRSLQLMLEIVEMGMADPEPHVRQHANYKYAQVEEIPYETRRQRLQELLTKETDGYVRRWIECDLHNMGVGRK